MPTIEEIREKVPTRDEMSKRWPRLIESMQWVAILSKGEALNGLETYLWNREFGATFHGCEAVAHFGGPESVIRAAIRNRSMWRAINAERQRRLAKLAEDRRICPICAEPYRKLNTYTGEWICPQCGR